MGYVEAIMGDSEQAVYQTHQHVIVLIGRILGWLFAFLVFLGLALATFFMGDDKNRFYIGVIALGTLLMPVYLILSAWLKGQRGRGFLERIWRPALVGVVILAVALVMMFRPQTRPVGWVAVVLALFPFAGIVRAILDWLNERYIITNRRVMEIKGVVNKEVSDSALEKVNDVKMRQSIVGRVLGYGTVEIITGSDIGVNMFHRISDPVRFKRAMLNAKEQLHVVDSPAPVAEPQPVSAGPTAPGGPASDAAAAEERRITDLIEELADLHRRGIISENEFQVKKEELLARL